MNGGALRGRRIVVTRSRPQAGELTRRLEREGAHVIETPSIRLAPPDDYGPVDRAIDRLTEYGWVVFTSQNAVAVFMNRLGGRGRSAERLRSLRLAAIGPATAAALRRHGLTPEVAPDRFVAEALVAAFAANPAVRGARMLLPRAAEARSVLPDGLRGLGAEVDVVPVYRVEVERQQDPEAWGRLLDARVDAVTFTSPSTVRNFLELLGPERPRVIAAAVVACIGPVTAAAAAACGLRVGVTAQRYTIPGLVDALLTRLGPIASAAG